MALFLDLQLEVPLLSSSTPTHAAKMTIRAELINASSVCQTALDDGARQVPNWLHNLWAWKVSTQKCQMSIMCHSDIKAPSTQSTPTIRSLCLRVCFTKNHLVGKNLPLYDPCKLNFKLKSYYTGISLLSAHIISLYLALFNICKVST
jgi:hypothetical protein